MESATVAAAGEPWRGREQQLERPAVAHALAQVAVAVGVGVDQPRVHELVARRPGIGHVRKLHDDFLAERRQRAACDQADENCG